MHGQKMIAWTGQPIFFISATNNLLAAVNFYSVH